MEENNNPSSIPPQSNNSASPPVVTEPKPKSRLSLFVIGGIIVVLLIAFFGGGYYFLNLSKAKPALGLPTPTLSPQVILPTPTTNQTANWQTYEGNGFSLKYPSTWLIHQPVPTNADVSFTSSDYQVDGRPNITAGFIVNASVNKGYCLGYLNGTQSSYVAGKQDLDLNGKTGKLLVIGSETETTYLIIPNPNKDACLSMGVADDLPLPTGGLKLGFDNNKTFTANRQDFIIAAESLQTK